MKRKIIFKSSAIASLGVELELQLIDPVTYDLVARAKNFMRAITDSKYQDNIKPEITQSMLEINSSVHQSVQTLVEEFLDIQKFLLQQADLLGVHIAGGGTHPFQKWTSRKIFPAKRFKDLSRQYRYLSKRATVFGQHVHIGCAKADDAIYLTHAFARYVPHFIALSASSPFYQGVDTGYQSTRLNIFNGYPTSGVMPALDNWHEFVEYYTKMFQLKIITSMKDFYWDIRPKPEFGTVEVRICDAPLTLQKSVNIAAYIQTLAYYLLQERPVLFTPDLYLLYGYNRFQAARYGFEGDFIHPLTLQHILVADDIFNTVAVIKQYAQQLKTMPFIAALVQDVKNKKNDAIKLRNIFKKNKSLQKIVQLQCALWQKE